MENGHECKEKRLMLMFVTVVDRKQELTLGLGFLLEHVLKMYYPL
jgi:hypothetical protein